eukprot:4918954-Pyramimonas_sp.AAC.1
MRGAPVERTEVASRSAGDRCRVKASAGVDFMGVGCVGVACICAQCAVKETPGQRPSCRPRAVWGLRWRKVARIAR